MAINSSKSKTGLLTVLQQDQDLRPSWNIYPPRWSGKEVAMQETYRTTRVVDTNFLCIICNIELFSTAFMRTARHYLIFYMSESYSIKMGKNRWSMSWAITRGKREGRYNRARLPGSSGPDYCPACLLQLSHASKYHVRFTSYVSTNYLVYTIYGRPSLGARPKRYKLDLEMVLGIMISLVQMSPKPRMPLPRGPHALVSVLQLITSDTWGEVPLPCLQRPGRRRVSRRHVSCVRCYR